MVVAALAIALLVYATLLAAVMRSGRPWVNPIFLVLVYYFFNYPVRALLIYAYPDNFNTHSFTREEVLGALEYSTLYVILFAGAYLLLLHLFRIRFDLAVSGEGALDSRMFLLATAVVLASGVVTIGYELSVSGSFSLATDIEELRRPFWVNLVALPHSLSWFAICMGFLLWLRHRSVPFAIATALLVALTLVEAFLTTGKAYVIALVMLLLFVDNVVNRRVIRLSLVAVGGLCSVLFATYSYYARLERSIGIGAVENYLDLVDLIGAGVGDAIAAQLVNILDRGTYYLDAVILMGRSDAAAGAGPYAWGSLVELFNLVPRAFNIVPEQYSFDRHVTWAVWGDASFAQVFIGRIGESFFVLGAGGLAYALIYAVVFAAVAARWRFMSRSVAGTALYFAILQGWLYQDASLVYQVKNLIAILLCYALVRTACALTLPRNGPAAQASQEFSGSTAP